jgi:hypothetical protein
MPGGGCPPGRINCSINSSTLYTAYLLEDDAEGTEIMTCRGCPSDTEYII